MIEVLVSGSTEEGYYGTWFWDFGGEKVQECGKWGYMFLFSFCEFLGCFSAIANSF